MEEILELLRQNARLSIEDIAAMTKKSAAEVAAIIKKMEDDGVILKYAAIINPEKTKPQRIRFVPRFRFRYSLSVSMVLMLLQTVFTGSRR